MPHNSLLLFKAFCSYAQKDNKLLKGQLSYNCIEKQIGDYMRNYRCRRGRRMGPEEDYMQPMRGRPLKEIEIEAFPKIERVVPSPQISDETVFLSIAEYEALRLVDLEGLNQFDTGNSMNVSRGTIWRLLDSGRRKLIQVIAEGKNLEIEKQ